jgi:hypothetical protein
MSAGFVKTVMNISGSFKSESRMLLTNLATVSFSRMRSVEFFFCDRSYSSTPEGFINDSLPR